MSKHTVDDNCMNEKMLIVMFSTKPAKGENIHTMNKKKVNKNIFFLYLTGSLYSTSSALDPSAILTH